VQYVVVYSVHDVWSGNVCQSVSMIVFVVCKKVGLTSVTDRVTRVQYGRVQYGRVQYGRVKYVVVYIVHAVWSVSRVVLVVVVVVVVMVCKTLWPTSVPSMTTSCTCHFRVASTANSSPDTARCSHRGYQHRDREQ
jgi:hypothetical protein